jgi:hypothetical protein
MLHAWRITALTGRQLLNGVARADYGCQQRLVHPKPLGQEAHAVVAGHVEHHQGGQHGERVGQGLQLVPLQVEQLELAKVGQAAVQADELVLRQIQVRDSGQRAERLRQTLQRIAAQVDLRELADLPPLGLSSHCRRGWQRLLGVGGSTRHLD